MAEHHAGCPGWDAITAALLAAYPGQTDPVHYAPLLGYWLGGGDPLDGISIYDGGDFYHFVTYGFSELYDKESDDPAWSGFGLELTLKLRKEGIRKHNREQQNICGILQTLARTTFDGGEIYRPLEFIYTGQTTGIDGDGRSPITGFLTTLDDTLGEIQTPNGRLQFVQLIGVTDAELRALVAQQQSVSGLLAALGTTVTDYLRTSVCGG